MGPIVLYDGTCGVCDAVVQALLRLDRRGVLRYAPLGGETAKGVEVPGDVDSIVLLEGGRATWYSDALFGIVRHLGWPWRLLGLLRIVPRAPRDAAYRWFARNRHRVLGRRDACRIPRPGERERFLP